ncbi:amidohydrolase family protein [Streptomyces olivaceus]|uniref:amidohydrolase family protein n=1 Tax=Streptomyces olivaceus TaxID=47716 RepID=UPI0018856D36|nr:amidohydrolase family protein [Streptomyces olivaceus]
MADRPAGIIDGGVHLWDPRRTDLWPFLATEETTAATGVHSVPDIRRRFDEEVFLKEFAGWNPAGYVLVTTASDPLAEVREAERAARATGLCRAVIGEVDITRSDIQEQIERLALSPVLRGVRTSAALRLDHTSESARTMLAALERLDLVYDLLFLPQDAASVAGTLRDFPGLTVVVEHCGLPLAHVGDAEWRHSLEVLADREGPTFCKISGLPLCRHETDGDVLRPYVDHCLDVFGPECCFFGSNFPPDGQFGTSLDTLYSRYLQIAAARFPDHLDALFRENVAAAYDIAPARA